MNKANVALLCAVLLGPGIAVAEQDPLPLQSDPRMRYIPYAADQVFHLSTAVGATLVVGFSSKESVTQVAVTDSKDLKAQPAGNYLFFKSQTTLPLQPVIVLTTNDVGAKRRYVFEITTVDTKDLGPNAEGVYYSVQFTYPDDDKAAAAARWAATRRTRQEAEQVRIAQLQVQLAHDDLERRARDPYSEPRNWHYIAQGSRSIMPLEVWDTGFSTVFRFPGNVRVPSIFFIGPDGKEATANYAVKNDPAGQGSIVQVDSVARGWRLRDGQTVLCLWNRQFDPVGNNPGTDTTSPNVIRVLKGTPE